MLVLEPLNHGSVVHDGMVDGQLAAAFSPVGGRSVLDRFDGHHDAGAESTRSGQVNRDRKSTRLNSSHVATSYAVCCLKKQITNSSGQPVQHLFHRRTLQ